MSRRKFQNKDFQISVKTGTDANVSKFQKEAVLGEQYYATDTDKLYIATSTAGVSDATVSSISATAGGGGGGFTGVTLSNLSGTALNFDDFYGNVAQAYSGGSTPSWGSSSFLNLPAANLAGKFKKYDIADYTTMQSDIQTALSASGWMNNSMAYGSDLAVVGNSQVENSTTGPLYVWAGAGGTSVTTMSDQGVNFIPIIYGLDFGNSSGYGPTWGLTIVYDEMGYVEETYDGAGNYNPSGGSLYAAYTYGSTAGNNFSGWTMSGSDGSVGGPTNTSTASGDQA